MQHQPPASTHAITGRHMSIKYINFQRSIQLIKQYTKPTTYISLIKKIYKMLKEREYNSSLNQNEKDLNKCKKNSPCLWLEK